MANITIFGCEKGLKRDLLTQEINKVVNDIMNPEEYVITYIDSVVVNGKNESQPFIRIYSNSTKHVGKIRRGLKHLNLDIETISLNSFNPAK